MMSQSAVEFWLQQLALPEPSSLFLPSLPRLSVTEWKQLGVLARRHTVLPAVVRNLERLARSAEVTLDDVLVPMKEVLIRAAARSVMLRLRLEEIQQALRDRSVPSVVLKGTEFADRLYPDPALRWFTDIDILVPRIALESAGEVLRHLGYELRHLEGLSHAEPYGEQLWKHPRFPDFGIEIHWNLVNSPSVQHGVSVQFEDLQFESRSVDNDSPHLSAASLLLIAAVHGATSHGFDRLQLLCDVRQAACGIAGAVDANYLVEASARTGSRLALIVGLCLAHRAWNDPDCARLRDRLPSRPRDKLACWLITPRVVLRLDSKTGGLRRRAFRELLKRQ